MRLAHASQSYRLRGLCAIDPLWLRPRHDPYAGPFPPLGFATVCSVDIAVVINIAVAFFLVKTVIELIIIAA